MQVVRHGDVEHVDGVVREEVGVVGRPRADRLDAVEPAQDVCVCVADGDELRARRVILERGPAADGRGELPAHEAAADDADRDALGRGHQAAAAASSRAASSGPAPSCTTAASARTIAAGSACWMMLRP